MVQLSPAPARVRILHNLFEPLLERAERCAALTATTVGKVSCGEVDYPLTRFVFSGPKAEHAAIRIGLFAGLHGDEPAGAQALVELLCNLAEDPRLAKGYELTVFPVCNPHGFEHHRRENVSGLDLNREFWRGSTQPEVICLEDELRNRVFDGVITLHADDTSDGVYGYAHGRVINEALLRPALAAAARFLPLNLGAIIDGFEASEGIICRCFQGVLCAPREQQPQPFDVIFETPALASLEQQTEATLAALESILTEYRRFLAYGQHL